MGLINQEGYYKGVIVSGGFGVTAKGLPQSVWMLKATEVYDEDGQEYLPADSEADEITAYLCIFNHDGSENFNNPHIKKVTGWDGADFNVLSELDLTDVELSFRVGYGKDDYADKLGVNGVDVPDASPTRTVAKLNKAQIDALQAKHAVALAKTKAPVKAASVKAATVKGKGKGKTSGRPTAPKTEANAEAVGKCTVDDAYNECFALKRDDVSEKALNKLWVAAEAAVNVDANKITEEEYYVIKTDILKKIGKV